MRISDWSSDVCSSDLPAAETDDVRRAGESHGPGKDPAAPPLADECARDLLCERAAGKRHRALAHCRERERDGGVGDGGADLDHKVRAEIHRSEEHTSELQSLMRISYAVFRLRKKNHN